MSETSLRLCVYCSREKNFLFSGKKLKDGSKVYVDLNGYRWAGRRCPDCERKRVRRAVRFDQFSRDNVIRDLEKNGFEILSAKSPIKVKKDGKSFEVEIRRASAQDGKVYLQDNSPMESEDKLVILVFETVKFVQPSQLKQFATPTPS